MGIKVEGKRGDRARRRGVNTSDAPAEAPKREATDFTAFSRSRTAGNSKPAPVARPTRTAAASSPAPKPKPASGGSKPSSTRAEFNTAFAAARKAGKKDFMWNGKSYNTKMA